MKLHEYQKKGVTKKAFRNCLILKDEGRGCFWTCNVQMTALKRKAGASPRIPNALTYNAKYITK
jgi:hypothetical protein